MKCDHLVLYSALLFQEGVQLFLHDFLKEKDKVVCDFGSPPGQQLITDRTPKARTRSQQGVSASESSHDK